MKLAPNVRLLPKDKGEDAVIFAGDDAYSHAEHYMQGGEARKRGDKIPPVYLGRRDLGNLENLRIVDDGRLRAIVRRAGNLDDRQALQIETLLAVAGVKEARFCDENGELLEDWTPQLARLKDEYERGESLVMSCRELAENKKVVELPVRQKERAGDFREHDKNDWLLIASELPFSPPAEGETLATHAPNFWKWLRRSVAENDRKADRVLAALFMVLANRYDWQLFLEVTGPGGSGKSVMAEICTMLAGKANTVSASMKALEDARERALVVGFSLIIMPDMTRYAGDGAGIKAITGGDKVAIDPKHKAPYSTRIQAVVLAVNNNAMSFSDRSGGISRRRVIFNFSEVVPENERDPMLAEKIEGELAIVIRHLLTRFSDQDEAKRLLYEQQKSEEALVIKREGDSLVDFCGYLMSSVMCDGLLVGNAEIIPFSPRRYLYHAYLAYMRAHGFGKPVTLTRFGKDMPGAMAEYGREYMKRKTKHGLRSNVTLTEESEDWMPSCVPVTNDDSKN
ncbi:primase-like DNA-binding domain-containing protein [Escherichia coli]|uniref:primase-like DNA-binding domain-containing protein n=1 Tax=Escherichia coli TaxID=562 RepID=UPI000BE5B4F2|nr:primase-like DNA-binding domain-containing protein [Escherichia coli]